MLSSSSTKYQYKPLPGDGGEHIRIATINPGCFNDDIHVTLRVERFHVDESRLAYSLKADGHLPKYEAMSHCWGPPEEAGRIFLCDGLPRSPERIRDCGEKEGKADQDDGYDIWDR